MGAGIAVDRLGDVYAIGTTGYGGGANLTADFQIFRAFQAFISKITIR
jgi:hypothetical protein